MKLPLVSPLVHCCGREREKNAAFFCVMVDGARRCDRRTPASGSRPCPRPERSPPRSPCRRTSGRPGTPPRARGNPPPPRPRRGPRPWRCREGARQSAADARAAECTADPCRSRRARARRGAPRRGAGRGRRRGFVVRVKASSRRLGGEARSRLRVGRARQGVMTERPTPRGSYPQRMTRRRTHGRANRRAFQAEKKKNSRRPLRRSTRVTWRACSRTRRSRPPTHAPRAASDAEACRLRPRSRSRVPSTRDVALRRDVQR